MLTKSMFVFLMGVDT